MGKILTDDQVLMLRQAHRGTKDRKKADRIKAVLLLNDGFSYPEVAKILLLDDTTIRRYEEAFRKQGVNGLLTVHYTGGKSRLSGLQEAVVKEYFVAHTPQTAKEAAAYIKKIYHVEYTIIGVTKLMHRLGFVYKKPKRVPGKVDRAAQAQFVARYKQVREQLGKNDRIYFLDSTHPTHNTRAHYGWILKGKRNDKWIKSTSGRMRLNLNGALNLTDKKAIILEEKTIMREQR